LDWFKINGFPVNAYSQGQKPNYEAWWGLPALPKFNTANPAVREFLWAVARHWVQLGIDGWRLDVPEEIADPAFWQEFRRQVKSANPEAYLLGEIWRQAPEWLRGDRFDGVMNYSFATACLRFMVENNLDPDLVRGMSYAQGGHLSASGFADAVNQGLAAYQPEVSQTLLNPLGSHDTARFLTLARGDETALRLAVLFQMTYPGAPCVYYGDEIGMEGRRDPDCRRAFPWEEGRWNTELRAHFKRCIALRHAHPCLRRGEFALLHAEDDVFSFARRLGKETLVVALNASRLTQTPAVRLGGYLPEDTRLRDVWTGATITVSDGRLMGVELPPRSGSVWAAEPPQQQTDATRRA
jgi:neopullulanase